MEIKEIMAKSKKPIKFKSFYGFALTGAKKKGDRVIIGFQFNVSDEHSKESKLSMTQRILDDLVYPEIMRRVAAKKLDPSFRLYKAHVILFSTYSRNDVLLNDEVRIKGNIQFAKGKTFQPGEPVSQKDIDQILGLYPSEKNDPNAAHIMLIKIRSDWYFAVDLIFDREKVKKRFYSADTFLKSSEINLKKKLWSPFVDNLFSATELAIQSSLLLRHYEGYSRRQSHKKTREIFEGYCKTGNAPMTFLEHYVRMFELRKKGRYLTGVHSKQFTIKKTEAKQHVAMTKELIAHTNHLLQIVDYNRRPKPGDYIGFGTA